MEKNNDFFIDKAKGSFLGALIGNAVGTYIDKQLKPTAKDVEASMKFPGGGVHKVGSGQITDDGELCMALARGLIEGKGVLNLYTIANAYGQWLLSKPLNVGETLKTAISKAKKMNEHSIELMKKAALKNSMQSCSNGALMRITPLCIWCSKLTKEEICEAIKEETTLTHPNETVIQVNQFFGLAIAHLLNNDNDRKGAFSAAKFCEKTKNLGYVKIAFYQAFKCLLNGLNYVDAISSLQTLFQFFLEATLQEGGDTDTNCCIVGALIGASEGFKTIPEYLITPVLTWKMKKGDFKRPEELSPALHFEEVMQKLVECCPKKLEVSCVLMK